jgi:hypothetical protein
VVALNLGFSIIFWEKTGMLRKLKKRGSGFFSWYDYFGFDGFLFIIE